MTDRELLELAARAADVVHEGIYYADKGLRVGERSNGYTAWFEWWNPLTDDGDALRLATTLRLSIEISGCQIYVRKDGCLLWNEFALHDVGSEILAATRRAIVRAAAEIGRTR